MGRKFTVGQLLKRAKRASDRENDRNITDPEWKQELSTAYGELYSTIVYAGMRYFESEEEITTDGGDEYDMPADHLATIGVDELVQGGNGRRRRLHEGMVQERNYYSGNTSAESARVYAFSGDKLVLMPKPPSGRTYFHLYVPQPEDLSEKRDDHEVDVVTPDGEKFLTSYLKIYALDKEEADVRGAVAERERARRRLELWATRRALNTPRRHFVDDFDAEFEGRFIDEGDWRFGR